MSELDGTAFVRFLETFADRLHERRDELTQLDSAIGDADHGINMDRGFTAVRGKLAELDDKTMVDAMSPAVDAFEAASGEGLASALAAAADAAAAGRDRITPLTARKGRASYLGERSANHQDPGATSTTILFESLRDAFAGH